MILGTCVFYHVHFTPLTPNASSNQSPRPIDIDRVVLDLAKVEANLENSKKCKKMYEMNNCF
jgi:hypothetical protein